jgi:hypothetical protein
MGREHSRRGARPVAKSACGPAATPGFGWASDVARSGTEVIVLPY